MPTLNDGTLLSAGGVLCPMQAGDAETLRALSSAAAAASHINGVELCEETGDLECGKTALYFAAE